MTDAATREPTSERPLRPTRWPWVVAATAFVALMGAAGFRSAPGVLIDPLHEEFGWSTGTISTAVSLNLLLYGLVSPFAAALMERFGMRRVVGGALLLVAAGSGLTVFMTEVWQLLLLWGVLVGVGTGSMALAFVATVTGRWFVRRRGLVRAGRRGPRVPATDGPPRRDPGLAGGVRAGLGGCARRGPGGLLLPARSPA